MTPFFADTFYYLALINPRDAAHERVINLAQSLFTSTVTTAWVLTEVADAFSHSQNRRLFLVLEESLRASPLVTVVAPSEELFRAGIELYSERDDKMWSLTDCISFVVMKQRGLSRALTADHHFEQAGFDAVFARDER